MSVHKRTVLDRARRAAGVAWWRGRQLRRAFDVLAEMPAQVVELGPDVTIIGLRGCEVVRGRVSLTHAPEWAERLAEARALLAGALDPVADFDAWCTMNRAKRPARRAREREERQEEARRRAGVESDAWRYD